MVKKINETVKNKESTREKNERKKEKEKREKSRESNLNVVLLLSFNIYMSLSS